MQAENLSFGNCRLLILNSGSSSLKYRWFDMRNESVLASGLIERIGETGVGGVPDHRVALATLAERLKSGETGPLRQAPAAIGHRVVHGGERFHAPIRIDTEVAAAIRATIPLAPLHNPANLLGIEACRELWPEVPQVAVFDTAFHQTMPELAFRYALPQFVYHDLHVRRYGFHGISFASLTRRAVQQLGKPVETVNLILLHLGSGASACAVRGGRSVDTSMGMTPTAGLVMGSRCGDLDPGVFPYLLRQGFTPERAEAMLNRESGLFGLCGVNDMREALARAARGDRDASLAVAMYAYRIRHYIGGYYAVLGGFDALVFSGGVGEHSAEIRSRVCQGLEGLGLRLDPAANLAAGAGRIEIQAADAARKILVIPADEELEIARQTWRLVNSQ